MKTYLRVLKTIEAAGTRAWLVGDPARDVVRGLEPTDLDVAVERCDLEALATSLGSGTLGGDESFPVLRATLSGVRTEIACIRGASIEEDLAQRDFSINAIAIRSDNVLVDPWNGRRDIRNGVIRLTGDDIDLVRNDPIRILRMFRFASELDMDIFWKSGADVRQFINTSSDAIRSMPSERWGREILSGMNARPWDFLYLCDYYGLLPFFMEEIQRLKEIPLEDDESQSLFDHSLETVRAVQEFLKNRKTTGASVALPLAAIFHHAGAEKGSPTDTKKAAKIASRCLMAWNMGSETTKLVETVIQHYHAMYNPVTEEQFCRSLLKHGFEAPMAIVNFAICNSRADKVRDMETLVANKWRLSEVLRRFEDVRRRMEGNTRYLTGSEVMSLLNIQPGKVVGEILGAMDMAVGLGIISSKKEASEWVKHYRAES
ncbi:MAG: hypothetical protein LBR61_13410 [Synergistaceae bacterium]|jgi:tRNA nucleotidyltransferase/poly(A) polymerase|nr:hypothetical protein [Synergistaceae bacterium]